MLCTTNYFLQGLEPGNIEQANKTRWVRYVRRNKPTGPTLRLLNTQSQQKPPSYTRFPTYYGGFNKDLVSVTAFLRSATSNIEVGHTMNKLNNNLKGFSPPPGASPCGLAFAVILLGALLSYLLGNVRCEMECNNMNEIKVNEGLATPRPIHGSSSPQR